MNIRIKRFLALVIDYTFIFFTFAALSLIIGLFIESIQTFVAIASVFLVLFVYLYFTVLPMFFNGMTIGTSVFNLKIIASSGRDIRFIGLTLRNFHLIIAVAIGVILGTVYDVQQQMDGLTYEELSESMKRVYDSGMTQVQYALTLIILIYVFFGLSVLILGHRGLHDLIGRSAVVDKDDY